MSFSQLKYDDDTYVHRLKESIGPGDYMLNMPTNNCDGCYYFAPGLAMTRAVSCKNPIDVDSELLNITRKASDCPSKKYIPGVKPFCQPQLPLKECHFLTPESTLISNPKCTNHERTANRWEWLCKNPQDKALVPFDYAINNRLVVKDSWRPCLPNPVNQYGVYPPECNKNIEYDWSSKYLENPGEQNPIITNQLATCKNIPLL